MWDNVEGCCYWCKSTGLVEFCDDVEIIKCFDCRRIVGSDLTDEGARFTEFDSGSSFINFKPTTTLYFPPSNMEDPQNLGSDPVSIIADMADRLGLDVIVKNEANEIYTKVEDQFKGKGIQKRYGLFAACIYVACREKNTTRSLAEISSVTAEAKQGHIYDAIEYIAETLSIEKLKLLDIKPADFTTRFCKAIEVGGDAIQAAHTVTGSFENKLDSKRSPESIAAAVTYRAAQIYLENKLLTDIVKASGIEESEIKETYEEFYPR